MLDISINSKEKVAKNFVVSVGKEGTKYRFSVEAVGFAGTPYSSYFGVVFLNASGKELSRKIHWLNDFSGIKYKKSLVFIFPKDAKKMVLILRVNTETPIKAETHFQIYGLERKFEEDKESQESFSYTNDYKISLLDELTKEQEDMLEGNLIWIIGAPRSGTSWLGTKLLSYQALSWNEPQIGLHLGMRQTRIKKKIVRHIDLFEKEPDYFFSQQYSPTWNYFLRKLILNRIFAQFQDLNQKIIIKEPNGSIGIDIITQCLPQSKIIFLIRDGRDTIDSKLDSFKKDSWAIQTYGYTPVNPDQRLPEIQFQSYLWVKLMEILETSFEHHSEEKKIMLKYEDLRNNTLNELKKIYQFIGINIPGNKLEEIIIKQSFENMPKESKGKDKVIRSASPGNWKNNFSQEEIDMMEKIMGSKLKQLGY